MSASNAAEKGLPVNVDAERFVLGSILLDDSFYIQAAGTLEPDDFSLDKHRRIFRRMGELQERNEKIDRVTVANELMKFNELEACDGLSYLVSLDDGLPHIPNLDSYIRIVKDKAVLRRIIFASQNMMNRCLMGEEEPGEILAGAEETLLKLGEARVKTGLLNPGQILQDYDGGINAFLDPSKRIKGISTGFAKLDEMTGGMHGGDLIILAARPSMGKTALALNVAQHVALKLKQTVAVFSLEMSKESLLTRMLCATARVDSQKFRGGYLSQEERRKLGAGLHELVEAPLYIDDTAGLHLMDMHAKLRRLQAERKLGLVIVDYLQLMTGRGRFENRNQEVSALSRGMKLLAKEMNVPMMVLSQLSRAVESRQGDHRPQLSDLRESGCLAGDTLVTIACTGAQVPIRELVGRANSCAWALDEGTWRLQPAAIERAFSTGRKPVFRLTSRLGRTIRATANHQFLTFEGWKRLDQLQPGDRLALPRHLMSSSARTMTDAELALLGHLLGDGCTLAHHVIQYTTKDRDLADSVAGMASEVFGGEVDPRVNAERGWFQVYLTSTRHHTHGTGSAVADWLRELGGWDLRSWEKRIPARVFEQPMEQIALFLRHLWATDGCIHVSERSPIPRVYYASSSHGLALDVQSALLRLGINARVARISQRGKGRDQFHVQISGRGDLDTFVQRVGAFGDRKSAVLKSLAGRLAATRANTNRDIIPRQAWRGIVVPACRQMGLTTRDLMKRIDTAYCGTTLYRANLSRDRAQRVAEAIDCEELRKLAASDVYWDEVRSVEPDGIDEVFDLTIPGLHNFVAGDIIVHNSIEQDADVVGFIFREEVYNKDREDLRGLAELIVAKQRNGPIGTVNLVFLHAQTKFENRAEDTGELPEE
jgi:replicative DNA helicase